MFYVSRNLDNPLPILADPRVFGNCTVPRPPRVDDLHGHATEPLLCTVDDRFQESLRNR